LAKVAGFYFNTSCSIAAVCEQRVLDKALELCAAFDALLSKTAEGSDVWRINHAQGEPTAVSTHTARIVQAALEVGRASDGAFNIALGSAVALWSVTSSTPRVPAQSDIETALALANLDGIELCCGGDNTANTVGATNTVRVPTGASLDLGGIAKGYISDQIAAFLRAQGVRCALLNFGGNVVTVGTRPDGEPWHVGLSSPEGRQRDDLFAVVNSSDGCVVTSGAYERGFDADGVRYHHILDPRTGWPAKLELSSVTLVGTNAMLADALATALFIMGRDEGIELASRLGFSVILLDTAGVVTHTKGLPLTLARTG
jgi:thiamine biosynthesis lipoprotein